MSRFRSQSLVLRCWLENNLNWYFVETGGLPEFQTLDLHISGVRRAKAEQAGAFRAGTLTKPVRGESRGQRPMPHKRHRKTHMYPTFVRVVFCTPWHVPGSHVRRPSGSEDRFTENQKPLFRRNKQYEIYFPAVSVCTHSTALYVYTLYTCVRAAVYIWQL